MLYHETSSLKSVLLFMITHFHFTFYHCFTVTSIFSAGCACVIFFSFRVAARNAPNFFASIKNLLHFFALSLENTGGNVNLRIIYLDYLKNLLPFFCLELQEFRLSFAHTDMLLHSPAVHRHVNPSSPSHQSFCSGIKTGSGIHPRMNLRLLLYQPPL